MKVAPGALQGSPGPAWLFLSLSSASLTLRESEDHLFPITDSQPHARRIGSVNANNEKSPDSGWNALNFGPRAVALRKVCSEDK